jgi:hypothetical protein
MRKHQEKQEGKMKRILSIVLAVLLVASLGASAYAADDTASPKTQLQLIVSQIDSLKQDASTRTWYYCVTDLDHDGCLEFLAASLHPTDRSTNLKVWIVSPDGTALNECSLAKDSDESFPDIMADTVDTYHVKDTDTWYYMVNDNVVISDTEVYTVKTAFNLKNGVLDYDTYAVEHTVVDSNGNRNVSCTDMNGLGISADQYNAAGTNNFAGAARSNTAFEWLVADEIGNLDRLTESYEVFLGTREPTEAFPVPMPAALGGTPAPVPTPAPQPGTPTYLMITKNPTNENRNVGENAIFVACANAYESLNWTFVSPNGGEYTPANFLAGSGATISGEHSTTITVSGLEDWMDGWGAYCSFYFRGQTARTSTAYICINSAPPPVPPTPAYGSMSGTASEAGGGYAINLQNGDQVYVDAGICNIEGEFYDGCTAMVYYTDYPSADNIYQVDIYGNQGFNPQPTYGTMSGTASEGGGGYAINLDNGDQVYVDAGICNVEGQFYDGCSALVYYTDYPSADNIYQVDIYGNQGLIIPDGGDHATGFNPPN